MQILEHKSVRLEYPLELVLTGISFLLNSRRSNKYMSYDSIRSLLLYTLEEKNGKWLPLNREYKPLGLSGYGNWVDYDFYDFLLIEKERVKIENVPKQTGGGCYYFFDDGSYPRCAKSKKKYIDAIENVFDCKQNLENIRKLGFR